MDLKLTHALNHLLVRHDMLEDPLAWYASASELLFLVALTVALLVAATRRGAVVALIAVPTAVGAAAVTGSMTGRARPFAAHAEIHAFVRHAADSGFPSDHATASFAIATAVLLSSRRAGVALLLGAVALAVDRVAVGVHYPTDVLAGAAIGVASGLAADRLWSRVAPSVARWTGRSAPTAVAAWLRPAYAAPEASRGDR